jgi:exodeoxyribonuclease VII large subunit
MDAGPRYCNIGGFFCSKNRKYSSKIIEFLVIRGEFCYPSHMHHLQKRILTVSELTIKIKSILETKFYYIWLEGEISNFRTSASGHSYFTIKDEGAQLRGVIFKSQMNCIRFSPHDGIHVICRGMISVYTERGEYQLIVDYMEPKGIGARQYGLEQLKKRLAKDGYFDETRKRPLPILPRKIGIVTSPTGAAIRDILNILERRFSNIGLLLYPVKVQGVDAAGEVAEGIRELNNYEDVDVIIVGRGGGSVEDLWAFNEEIVARSIYKSRVPVISAVGHEIDYTLADMVADLRVPTPSAAAEIVVKSKEEFTAHFAGLTRRIRSALMRLIGEKWVELHRVEKNLIDPRRRLGDLRQRLDDIMDRLNLSASYILTSARKDLQAITSRLNGLSPLGILDRGYSIARKIPSYTVIKEAEEVSIGEDINVVLCRGELFCKIYEKDKV